MKPSYLFCIPNSNPETSTYVTNAITEIDRIQLCNIMILFSDRYPFWQKVQVQIRVFTVCNSFCILLKNSSEFKSLYSSFRVITVIFLGKL